MNTSHRAPSLKKTVYEHISRLGQAVSNPIRLELLDLLAQGPRTVDALARQTGQSVATTSHHLQTLRRSRLVEAEKSGLYVTYRLGNGQVDLFLLHLRRLAEDRLTEIHHVTREFLSVRGALEPVDTDELARRIREEEVTLIDVRPPEEYAAGHIPGALSIPLPELPKRLKDLKKGRDVVAYCRGPYCVMALDAVDLLRQKGFGAMRLEMSVSEWKANGWNVHTGRSPRD